MFLNCPTFLEMVSVPHVNDEIGIESHLEWKKVRIKFGFKISNVSSFFLSACTLWIAFLKLVHFSNIEENVVNSQRENLNNLKKIL